MYTGKKNKVAAVFSYLGWPFWIAALIIRSQDDPLSRRHLNQGFLLAVAGSIAGMLAHMHGIFSFAAGILGAGIALLSIAGILRALRGSSEPLPIVGEFRLI